METQAKIISDSISPLGVRLTSIELCFPRFILPQVLTHRMWSRSTESSRARPVKSKIAEVEASPVRPQFRLNRKGMSAGGELEDEAKASADIAWEWAIGRAIEAAEGLAKLGVAKQWVNRLLEPFAYVKMLVTATDFANFFRLRCADDAQPEIQELATRMRDAMADSTPTPIPSDGWHRPYCKLTLDEAKAVADYKRKTGAFIGQSVWNDVSAARCARVSYTTHDGKRDVEKDLELAKTLRESGHSNPFEAVATPAPDNRRYGNLRGWVSYRYQMEQDGRLPNAEG